MKIDLSRMFEVEPRQGLSGVRQFVGTAHAEGLRFGIAASRFNADLTGALVDAAVQTLVARGARVENITVAWVPGAFEIPFALMQLARGRAFHALIGLGAVLEGATAHAQMISTQTSRAMVELAMQYGIPVVDGIVCTNGYDLAAERCLDMKTGRGWYCAMAAIESATLAASLAKAEL